jgi:predicted ATPase/transcriptional regulator with XRE-family HTH domain
MSGTTDTQGGTFGGLLRRYRLEAGLSQEALAERAGISPDAVAALERGRRNTPRPATLALLVDALNLQSEGRAALIAAATGATPEPVTAVETTVRSPAHRPLPVPITPIIGREHEEAALLDLMLPARAGGVRLITLTGPGGIGKTRLALHVAAAVQTDYVGGVVFVDLSPLTDPETVGASLAAALDVRPSGADGLWDAIAARLRGRETLLVLDNVEQVVEAAPHLASLLEVCPLVSVLATSRIPLRVRAERRFPVPTLAIPDATSTSVAEIAAIPAVRLFVARAQAVQPGFALTEKTAPIVEEVCRRLDGLPLAIELAAARTRLLGAEALLARLDRRIAVLTGGSRDLPARQQTIGATIDWSHDLLDEDAQTLFARMAVFAGGATLEAVESVCGDGDTDVTDGVERLLDSSLVVQLSGDRPRVGMLETIHDYAIDRLRRHGDEEMRRRDHAQYYLTLAEALAPELVGTGQAAALTRFREEENNLRSALSWLLGQDEVEPALRLVVVLWRVWFMTGQAAEGKRWLVAVLDLDGASAPELRNLRMQALRGTAALCLILADLGAGEAFARQSVALARELGDSIGTADALNALGNILRNRGEAAAAVPSYEESLAVYREAGEARGVSVALNNLGVARRRLHDPATAAALHEESLAIRRGLDDTWGVTMILLNLGHAALDTADLDRAALTGEESLALSRQLGNAHGVALALDLLARVDLAGGDAGAAQIRFVESLMMSREVGDRGLLADTLMGLVDALARDGDAKRATRLLACAVGLQASVRPEREWGERRDALAAVLRAKLGDGAFAAEWARGESLDWEESVSGELDPAE